MEDNRALNPPPLAKGLLFYYNAFLELATLRYYDGGPIPITEMMDYATRHELDDSQFQDLLFFSNRLDTVLANHREKEVKKDQRSKKIGRKR